jgi:hypothetical protein
VPARKYSAVDHVVPKERSRYKCTCILGIGCSLVHTGGQIQAVGTLVPYWSPTTAFTNIIFDSRRYLMVDHVVPKERSRYKCTCILGIGCSLVHTGGQIQAIGTLVPYWSPTTTFTNIIFDSRRYLMADHVVPKERSRYKCSDISPLTPKIKLVQHIKTKYHIRTYEERNY